MKIGEKKLWVLLTRLETAYKLLSMINFVLFLIKGEYRSIIDRILQMRLVYIHPGVSRTVNFDYMNRQLVWHGFTEFLLFLMPLINVEKIKSFINRKFSTPRSNLFLPANSCPICLADPINSPYISNCNHTFCYFCLKQNMLADRKYSCPRCGTIITDITRNIPIEEPTAVN